MLFRGCRRLFRTGIGRRLFSSGRRGFRGRFGRRFGGRRLNRWLFLIRGLIGSQGVRFTPTEERVINKVLRHLTGWSAGASQLKPVTIPQVWAALDKVRFYELVELEEP